MVACFFVLVLYGCSKSDVDKCVADWESMYDATEYNPAKAELEEWRRESFSQEVILEQEKRIEDRKMRRRLVERKACMRAYSGVVDKS